MERTIRIRLYVFLALYFSLHLILRTCMSQSLELDEAEQAFLSQWLLLGYGSKPPLYTWMQIGFNNVFGLDVFSLSLLKNLLLFATYALMFESGRILLKDNLLAALAAGSLLLIPQIAWESQRDLTHSVLVTLMASMAVYMTLCLVKRQSTAHYIGLGAVFGLGMISKYNFAILVGVLVLVLAVHKQYRHVLKDKRVFWLPSLMLLLAAPYFLWFVQHLELATGSVDKLGTEASGWLVPGIWNLTVAVVSFLTPLWILFLAFFLPQRAIANPTHNRNRQIASIFHTYFLLVLGMFIVAILLFNISEIKARWLQPLLFVFPLYLFSFVDRSRLSSATVKRYYTTLLAVAFLILLLMPLRVVLGPKFQYTTNFNIPYQELASRLTSAGLAGGLVITPDSTLGGNLHLHMPDTCVMDPIMASQLLEKPPRQYQPLVLVWDVEDGKNPGIPSGIQRFMETNGQLPTRKGQVRYVALPYEYSVCSMEEHVFGYLTVQASI